jgi:Leucine-rich repeat (LRR) protein
LCEIKADAFKGLDNLISLDLSCNRLESFESGTFDCLPSLEYLRLENNRIKRVPPGLFNELKKLKELRLEGNPLDLHEDTFTGLESLTQLSFYETPYARSAYLCRPDFAKHLRSDVDIQFFQ